MESVGNVVTAQLGSNPLVGSNEPRNEVAGRGSFNRFLLLAALALTAGCDDGSNEPKNGEDASVTVDGGTDAVADATTDSSPQPQGPSCEEINANGEECELIIADQGNGLSCVVPVLSVDGGGVCYPDICAIAFGDDPTFQPRARCMMIIEGIPGDTIASACVNFETSDGAKFIDTVISAPAACAN